MQDDNIEYQEPFTNDIYCYTQLAHDGKGHRKYYTVLFGPLMKIWIASGQHTLESTLGVHTFIVRTDQPMYLIPYDDEHADKYGKKHTFALHPDNPDEPDSITVPMEFELAVMRFFHYKIDAGKLYKKQQHKWLLQEL